MSEGQGSAETDSPPPRYTGRPNPDQIMPGRPITEPTLQAVRHPDSLAKLMAAVKSFDASRGSKGTELRNAAARELFRQRAEAEQGAGVESVNAVIAGKTAKEDDKEITAMEVDVNDDEEEKEDINTINDQLGMLPVEEEKSDINSMDAEMGIQVDGDHDNDNHDENGQGEEHVEGGENEPAKKKKKNKKKKKKSKLPSSPSAHGQTGGDATWAKGRGMGQDMEILMEEEIEVVEEIVSIEGTKEEPPVPMAEVVKVPASTGAIEIECQPVPVADVQPPLSSIKAEQPEAVDPSPISSISNEVPSTDSSMDRKNKKRRNKRSKPAAKDQKVQNHQGIVSSIKIVIDTMPQSSSEDPSPVSGEGTQTSKSLDYDNQNFDQHLDEPTQSPKKKAIRLDIAAAHKRELDLKAKEVQEKFIGAKVLKKLNEKKRNRIDSSFYLGATPARKLDFDKIAKSIKPEDKEVVEQDLVQIKKKQVKVDEGKAKDPEGYIETVPTIETEKVEIGESVITEMPIDITPVVEDASIVLSSPTTPKLSNTKSQSAPATASTWSLLRTDIPVNETENACPSTPTQELTGRAYESPPAHEEVETYTSPVPVIIVYDASTHDSPDAPMPRAPVLFDTSVHAQSEQSLERGSAADSPEACLVDDTASWISTPDANDSRVAEDPDSANGPGNQSSEVVDVRPLTPVAQPTYTGMSSSWSPFLNVSDSDSDGAIVSGDPRAFLNFSDSDSDKVTTQGDSNAFLNFTDSDSDVATTHGSPSSTGGSPRGVAQRDSSQGLPAIGHSPSTDTPPEQDLITPHDAPSPAFPKTSYPKSPLKPRTFNSSFRTASVNVSSPLATMTSAAEDDQLVPSRQNTPETDTTPTQSQVFHSPVVRRIESVDSFMDIGMPADVDYSNPASLAARKMNTAYTLYLTKSPNSTSPLTNGSGKTYPSLGVVDVNQYTGGLIPVFTADTFGDFFGTWKAFRRVVAGLVQRPIEPVDRGQMAPDTAGLGLHLFGVDKTAHFFNKNVRPAWEDPMCKAGGKIVISAKPAEVRPSYHELCIPN